MLPDGSIVLMGGRSSYYEDNYKNDVWRSTDNGATWEEMTESAEWSARSGHTSVVLSDGSIILMGGRDGSDCKSDVWRSRDKGATWELVTESAEWSVRTGHSSVVLPDGSILLMGGNYARGYISDYKSDVWRSDDGGETWTRVTASAGWSRRIGHTSVVLPDGSIILMGGFSGTSEDDWRNDVWRSDDGGKTWTEVTSSAGWSGRHKHTSVVLPDDSIVLMGGVSGDYEDNYKNDCLAVGERGGNLEPDHHECGLDDAEIWTQQRCVAGRKHSCYGGIRL